MITQLALRNFRSVQSLVIEFQPFNCFVGANNSGKSNIFDSLDFLADVSASGLRNSIQMRQGAKLRYYGSEGDAPIMLAISADSPKNGRGEGISYTLEFKPAQPYLVSETVDVISAKEPPSPAFSVRRTGLGSYQLKYRIGTAQHETSLGTGEMEPQLYSPGYLPSGASVEELNQVKSTLKGFEHYKFVPDQLKSWGPATHTEGLLRNGSNFASYLHLLHSSSKRVFNRVEDQLRKNFPDIDELLTPLSEIASGQTEVGIREKWFDRNATGTQLSDGLVGFLAHLVVLYGPNRPSLVIFEEPENYINPRLMERLVEMLKEASHEVQILISTHSPTLMNLLLVEDIVLIERQQGGTTARRVSDQHELRSAVKGWALGDAYASGLLDRSA